MSLKNHLLLAAPGAAAIAAAAIGLLAAADSAALISASHGYVYVALAAALVFAWRLHCSRLFMAVLLLAMVRSTIQFWPWGDDSLLRALCLTLLPVGVALLTFDATDGFSVARVRKQALLLFGPLAAGAFFCAGRTAAALQLLSSNIIHPAYTDWTHLPQIALIAVLVSFGVAAVRALRAQRASDVGLAWLIVALTCALAARAGSIAQNVWVLAGAVVLIVALVETAYAMAFHDELTGLPSRRALARMKPSLQAPYAVAIIDVDHFKSFNDEHGHDVGDQVLRMVAGRLREVRGGGKAFRSGGEEFTIVFPGLSKQEAMPHAEDVRAAVENAHFTLRKLPRPKGKAADAQRGKSGAAARRLQVTISVGVASATARSADMEAVVRAADKAMYRAKSEGRNRVVA